LARIQEEKERGEEKGEVNARERREEAEALGLVGATLGPRTAFIATGAQGSALAAPLGFKRLPVR
jgi:hypothetical protein